MQEPTYAGFWIRLMAVLIDTVILVALVLPLLVMFAPLPSGHPWAEDVTVLLVQSGLQTIAFTVLTLLFWKLKSATPGKLLLKQQIIDVNTGGKASTSQLLIRYIGYFVSAIPLGIGYIWAGLDTRKQAWHDKMAGTAVVCTSP